MPEHARSGIDQAGQVPHCSSNCDVRWSGLLSAVPVTRCASMHTDNRLACGMQNFLLHGRTGADRNYDWLEYFDVVITGVRACSQ